MSSFELKVASLWVNLQSFEMLRSAGKKAIESYSSTVTVVHYWTMHARKLYSKLSYIT
jgi:hypothetical protein